MRMRSTLMLVVLAAATSAPGQAGSAATELSTFDNAAYNYWQAAALIQDVMTEAQYDAVLFAEKQLPGLPPKAFAYRPVSGRWLLNERLMLEALHAGAGKPACRFVREGTAGRRDILLFRGAMQQVIQRALASAKAHEFVGNTLAAGSIYADLLRLLRHMDEGKDWSAVEFTLAQLPPLLEDIAGFLSRQPPRDALELIARELDAAGHPRFPIRRMLAAEAITYSEWLLADSAQIEAKVAGLYGDALVKPALNTLLQLEAEEDLARVQEWVDGYRNEVSRLGAAFSMPYPEAVQVIREIDGMVAGAARENAPNPLLHLLMPAMVPTYERFLAAEAHLIMIAILCQGAIYNDFVGGWPNSIEILAQFAGGTLPLDPFTGKTVDYDLKGALPRIEVDAPKSVRQAWPVTEINLRRRVEQDDEAVAALIRELQRQQRMEEAKAKHQGKSKADRNKADSGSLRSRVNRALVY